MKNINLQYRELLEGKMNQAQFLRNARMMFPNYVSNHNSFNDSVKILKTKGMIVESEAVKGTPDKEPTYDSPTPDVKTKYKKVEQSPEVDEQNGIYPATTLTDIPKFKANKKVKNTSDGLEPIKNNDTKNEMKKVRVVKESLSQIEADINKAIKDKKIDPSAVKTAAEKAMRGDSTELATLMAIAGKASPMGEGVHDAARGAAKKDITSYATQQRKIDNTSRKGHSDDLPTDNNTVGASHVFDKDSSRLNRSLKRDYPDLKEYNSYDDEPGYSDRPRRTPNRNWDTDDDVEDRYRDYEEDDSEDLDETNKSFDKIFADFIESDYTTELRSYIKEKGKEAIAKIKSKLPGLYDKARTKVAKLLKVELDEARSSKTPNKELNIRERLRPAITKLVQEVLDEMGQE
jgi:hypothetical protein